MSFVYLGSSGPATFCELKSETIPFRPIDLSDKIFDLNDYCIDHPSATYYVRVQGDSMIDSEPF